MKTRKYIFSFIIFCFGMLIVGGILELIYYYQGFWVPENKVSVSNLSICEGAENPNVLSDNVPIVAKGIEQIKICGLLYTKIPVILQIYLYSDEDKHPIFYNDQSDTIINGDFMRPISFNPISRPGSYSIEIYYSRHLLGKIDFMVLDK